MSTSLRVITTALIVPAAFALSAPAYAHECVNAGKKYHESGAQIVFGPNDEVLYVTAGLEHRVEQGLVDPETGEGFRGIAAFDFDGDGIADVSTWFGVGPDGEIPLTAQLRGPACRGLTNIGIYLEQCR